MKKSLVEIVVAATLAVCGVSTANAQAKSPSEKPKREAKSQSHAPTKQDINKSIDRAEQKKGQNELKAAQDKNRPKSDAEKATDKIPAKATPGIITSPGTGIKVTVPIKP